MPEQVHPTDPAYEAERRRVPLQLHASVRPMAKRCTCSQPDGSGRHEQVAGLKPSCRDAAIQQATGATRALAVAFRAKMA